MEVRTVQRYKTLKLVAALAMAFCVPLILATPALAADADIAKTQNFIKTIIQAASGFVGIVGAAFLVVGGFGYATSSGNPEKLDKSKQTITWALVGIGIVFAAFVISNMVTDIAIKSFGG